MKKHAVCFAVALVLALVFCGSAFVAAPFHIGVAATDGLTGGGHIPGRKAYQEYGDVASGGMIRHVTMPDNFMSEMETTISQIVGLSDDPKVKVIVVDDAIPGTTEAFRRVREKRPDVLCFAGNPKEDPAVISSTADFAIGVDNIMRGYLIIIQLKKWEQKIRTHFLPASHEL